MDQQGRLAIIGTGNIGRAMALGLAAAGRFERSEIVVTRRKTDLLQDMADEGFEVRKDNRDAVRRADVVMIAVGPQELDPVLLEIGPDLDDCYPLLHHAESLVALAAGDAERASYASRMGERVRTMLACRVIQDISEATQYENGDKS